MPRRGWRLAEGARPFSDPQETLKRQSFFPCNHSAVASKTDIVAFHRI